MADDNRLNSAQDKKQLLFARGDFIFTAAAIALIAGLLLPIQGRVLDLTWAVSLCLTAALLIIVLSAKNTGELITLPMLIAIAVLLRITACVASAKTIILITSDISAGTIVEIIGKPIASASPIWTIIIVPITAVVAAVMTHKAAGKINAASLKYAMETISLKKVGIETDLKLGKIDDQQAQNLKDRIFAESKFYLNMAGIAKLLRCDAAIIVLVIFVTIGGHVTMTFIDRVAPAEDAIKVFAPLVAGSAAITLVQAMVVSLGSAFLLSKESLSLKSAEPKEAAQTEKIEIVSEDTGRTEQVELLNPDFNTVMKRHRKTTPSTDSTVENIVDFEPVAPQKKFLPESIFVTEKFDTIEDYYDDIASRVNSSKTASPVMFAAASFEELPVTVAVNTAIRLTDNGKKCLLIDADTDRNPVAMVFDIPIERSVKDPAESCIEDLWIWSCPEITDRIIAKTSDFDRVIVYAPNISVMPLDDALLKLCRSVLLFSCQGDIPEKIIDRLGQANRQPAAVMPSPDTAVQT